MVAITDNMENRDLIEQNAVRVLKSKGIIAHRGVKYFPLALGNKLVSRENLKKIVIDNEIDGVITMSLLSKETSEQYIKGRNYTAAPYYDPYGTYIDSRYRTVSTPGYYVQNKTYVIEAVLHDLNLGMEEDDRLVWRGQSTMVDPQSVKKGASDFSRAVVNYLVDNELVK